VQQAISSLISIISGVLLIAVPSSISEFLYRHRSASYTSKAFRTAHSSYVSGFRVRANVLNLMFYPIFLFRRLAFAVTIAILYDFPLLQLSFINFGTCCVFFQLLNLEKQVKIVHILYDILEAF